MCIHHLCNCYNHLLLPLVLEGLEYLVYHRDLLVLLDLVSQRLVDLVIHLSLEDLVDHRHQVHHYDQVDHLDLMDLVLRLYLLVRVNLVDLVFQHHQVLLDQEVHLIHLFLKVQEVLMVQLVLEVLEVLDLPLLWWVDLDMMVFLEHPQQHL